MAHDHTARTAVGGSDGIRFRPALPIGHAALVHLWRGAPPLPVDEHATALPVDRAVPGAEGELARIDLSQIEDQLDRLTAK